MKRIKGGPIPLKNQFRSLLARQLTETATSSQTRPYTLFEPNDYLHLFFKPMGIQQ